MLTTQHGSFETSWSDWSSSTAARTASLVRSVRATMNLTTTRKMYGSILNKYLIQCYRERSMHIVTNLLF